MSTYETDREILFSALRELNMTQTELAAHLGLHYQTIYKWLTDRSRMRPRKAIITAIAQLYESRGLTDRAIEIRGGIK